MFGKIRQELKCLEGQCQKSNVWKDKTRNLMLGRIRLEFQYLKG